MRLSESVAARSTDGKPWPGVAFSLLVSKLDEIDQGHSGRTVTKQMKCLIARATGHGNPAHTIAIVSLVEFLVFAQIEWLLQSFRQLGVRRAFHAIHPRVTAVAAIDMLLISWGRRNKYRDYFEVRRE